MRWNVIQMHLSVDTLRMRPFGVIGSGSVIQDHWDHGASKEPMNPWSDWSWITGPDSDQLVTWRAFQEHTDCVRQNAVLIVLCRKNLRSVNLSIYWETAICPPPQKKILQGRMTSYPCLSMCFLLSQVLHEIADFWVSRKLIVDFSRCWSCLFKVWSHC